MAGVFGLSDFRVEQLEGNIDESANYGYIVAGVDFGTRHCTIDRIDFSNETMSLPKHEGTIPRNALAAVSGVHFGYFAGGVLPTRTSYVDSMDLSNETMLVPGNNLPTVRSSFAGVSTPNYGYFGGGFTPSTTNNISRLDFSTGTTATPPVGNGLTQARSNLTSVSNPDYGYFGGGFSASSRVTTIDRLDFSNETVVGPSVLGANLRATISSMGAISSSNYGYFGGGERPAVQCYVDRLDFANETVAQLGESSNLSVARWGLMGVSNTFNYGYFCGGVPPSPTLSTMDRLDFYTETTIGPSIHGLNLSQARYDAATITDGKSVNARIRKSTDKNGKSISGKYAYYGGGLANSPPPYQNIDRMEYATETMTTLPTDAQLAQRRSELSAAGNSNYGYFIGGLSGPQASSKIDRMDFSNETLTDNLSLNPPAFGGSGIKRTTSLANNNYIYTAGGAGPAGGDDDEVTRMDLSTEVLTSRNMLTYDRAWMASLKTPSYGYFCGGEGPPPFGGSEKSTYDRLDFSTESVNNSGFMITKRQEFASFQSPEYGYVAGGGGLPTYQCRIERLDFSSETFSYTTNSMPEGREGLNAFCNENFGYIAGGWSPGNRSVIDRMEFSSETMSLPGVNLSKGNSYYGSTVSDNGVTHT
jgi:hypothetical protein